MSSLSQPAAPDTGNLVIMSETAPTSRPDTSALQSGDFWYNSGGLRVYNGNTWVLASASASQVNSDWNATGGVAQILNKPTITAPVNSDWNATTGLAQILNKPTLGSAAFYDASYFATNTRVNALEQRVYLLENAGPPPVSNTISSATKPTTRDGGAPLEVNDVWIRTTDSEIFTWNGTSFVSNINTATVQSAGFIAYRCLHPYPAQFIEVSSSATTDSYTFPNNIPAFSGAVGIMPISGTLTYFTINNSIPESYLTAALSNATFSSYSVTPTIISTPDIYAGTNVASQHQRAYVFVTPSVVTPLPTARSNAFSLVMDPQFATDYPTLSGFRYQPLSGTLTTNFRYIL